jgi:hypothetical protein
MERNAAFIDAKFRRLKALRPGIRCVALAEAPHEGPATLARVVDEALAHADVVACSIDGLRNTVPRLGGRR